MKKKILLTCLFLFPLLDILALKYTIFLDINILIKLIFGFFIIFSNNDKKEMLWIILAFLGLKFLFNKDNFLLFIYLFDSFLGTYEVIRNNYKIKINIFYLLSIWIMFLFLIIKSKFIFYIIPVIYLIPVCLLFLKDHKNILTKIIYFLLLILCLVKLYLNPYLLTAYKLSSSYGFSYIHIVLGLIFLIYFAWNKKIIPLISSCLFIILNASNFNYLAFPYLILLSCLDENIDKDILLISNMYPNKKYKHYGSFVKNTYELLKTKYDVTLVKINKHKSFKALAYLKLYFLSIFYPMIYNYKYLYVHFISHSSLGAVISKKLTKTKLVLNAHGNDIIDDPKNEKRSKKYLKFADKVVVPSNYFKEIIMSYGVEENKIFIYPSGGVNTKLFKKIDHKKALNKLKLSSNYKYIGYVGRMEKDKGLDLLIKAFSKIKKDNYKLIIVGNGSLKKDILSLIDKLKLNKYIILYDFMDQKDLPYLYNSLDVFVFPSHRKSESLGLVGLEAMACEVNVVGSNNYGIKDYLNEENGFPFIPNNIDDLSKKIEKAMNTKSKKIKDNARKMALNYDIEKTKDKIFEVFE